MHGWVPRRTLAPMSCFCGLCTSRQPASHETSADTFRRHRNRGATTSRSTCRIPPPPPPPPPPVPRAPPPVPLLLPNAIDASAARSDGWSRIGGGRATRKALRYARSSARVRVDAVCSTRHAELCSSCQCEGDDGAWRCCDGYLLVMARSAQLSGSPPPPPSGPPEDEKRVAASLAPKPGTHGRVSKSRKIVTRNGACSSAHVLNDLARCISAAVEE